MTQGPLMAKIAVFSVPIVLSGLLQLLFNAADIAVVGHFTGSDALAAVSASGPVSSLIVMLFMGLSVGANVLCAQYMGAGKNDDIHETTHTSIAISLLIGVAMTAIGLAATGGLLRALNTPEAILPLAKTYLWIYFLGVPSTMVYNFGAAILRAVGDTRRPLYYLAASGALNVVLNLFFVIALRMGVAGVAIATVISQTLAAALILLNMARTHEVYRFEWRKMRIYRDKLLGMLRIGVPAGLQSTAFSISNMLIQSAVNSFGAHVMAAAAVANNVDGFCYVAIDALSQAALSFTGQNYGAGNYRRIDRIFAYTLLLGCALGTAFGVGAYLLAPQILSIYTSDPAVVEAGIQIMFIVCVFEFINCTMSIPFNVVRGMGHSLFPMLSTIICVCGLRVVWIYTVFAHFHTVSALFYSWPATKAIASVTGVIYYLRLRRQWRGHPAA